MLERNSQQIYCVNALSVFFAITNKTSSISIKSSSAESLIWAFLAFRKTFREHKFYKVMRYAQRLHSERYVDINMNKALASFPAVFETGSKLLRLLVRRCCSTAVSHVTDEF